MSIISAHVGSIREVWSKAYSEEQINVWSGRNFKVSIWRNTIDQDVVWVLDSGEPILGFGHLLQNSKEFATIVGLYFVPEAN